MVANANRWSNPKRRSDWNRSTVFGLLPAVLIRVSTECSRAFSSRAHVIGPFSAHVEDFSTRSSSVRAMSIGIKDADSAENNSGSKNIVIYPVACAVPDRGKNAPKLSGVVPEIRLRPGSYLQSFYGKDVVEEEFFCNFEVNPDFEWASIEAGFPIAARGSAGEVRAIESPTHRFFVATLFQPQLASKPDQPHPLIIAFLQAAADWGRKN